MSNVNELVKSVYIDPIKSVLVIDDEFVSLENMLNYTSTLVDGEDASVALRTDYPKKLDLNRAVKIIKSCRSEGRSWLCDIHDGRNIIDSNMKVAKHLHQSDLLILDYNLSGDHTDGTIALNFLTELSKNGHFNLVVVYTSSDINTVFLEITQRLSSISELIENWSEVDVSDEIFEWSGYDENIESMLSIPLSLFIDILQNPNYWIENLEVDDKLKYLHEIYKDKPDEIDIKFSDLFKYLIFEMQEKLKSYFQGSDGSYIEFINDTDVNWIKNDRIFITIVNKDSVEPDELPNCLLSALISWNPDPHRLLLAKIRTELDERGIYFEDTALKCRYTNAGWLQSFFDSDDDELKWITQKNVNWLWDSISKSLLDEAVTFSDKLKRSFSEKTTSEIVKTYNNLNLDDKHISLNINKHINSYVCSCDVSGNQISTGHILSRTFLKIDPEAEGERKEVEVTERFICLTPACDLVPSQKNDWKKNLGDFMPVKLVKLHHLSDCFSSGKGKTAEERFLSDLNSNNHILIKTNNGIEGFSIVKTYDANPQWEQAFLSNLGKICWANTNEPQVEVMRTGFDKEQSLLANTAANYEVIAQLRYEYAINLLQKFGFSQSRVGLDFIQFRR